MNKEQLKALEHFQRIADRFGYVLNPTERTLERLVKHLAEMHELHGEYFCPCKRHYPLNTEVDPTCPCDTFEDEISSLGHCECHLFYDEEAAVQSKRRPGLLAAVTCPG